MAEVPGAPYEPFSTETPTERPIPLSRPDVSGAAFGENIARALQTFGGDVKTGGEELWQRAVALQRLKNETNAREAEVAYTQAAAGKQEQYLLLRERAAQDGLQPHLADLEATRQQFRKTLNNPEAQSIFDTNAASIQNFYTRSAAAHAAQGGREYLTAGNKAQLDILSGSWADYKDPTEFDTKIAKGEKIIRQNDSLENKSLEETEDDVKHWRQRIRGSQILGLSWDQPKDAMLLLETHKGELDPETYNNIRKQVENRFTTVVGDQVSDHVSDTIRNTGGTVEDGVDAAKKAVKNDPIAAQIPGFESKLANDVRSKIRAKNFDEGQDAAKDQQTIMNVLSAPDANYKDRSQLLAAHPELKDSIANLQRTKSGAAFLLKLDSTIQHDWNVHHSEQMDENYKQLRGEADSLDPRVRAKFLEDSLNLDKFELKKNDWKDLMARRERILTHPEQENPIVKYALGLAKIGATGQILKDLGVDKLTDENADLYHKWTGTLSVWIDQWMQNHDGARPNDQQLREEIILPALRERSSGGVFGMFTHKRGYFDFDMSPETMKQYKERESSRMSQTYGLTVTPDQVSDQEAYQAATRDLWDKLFGGKKASGGNPTVSKPAIAD